MKFLNSISFIYIALSIVTFITIYINLLKHGANKRSKYIIMGIALLLYIITFNYFNGLVKTIFDLKYLSIKSYFITIIIVNIIMLYTINNKFKFIYKIYNYILFILLTIIFGATISIILGNKIKMFYLMDISNATNLIDLSMVLFIIYLLVTLTTYIGFYLFEIREEIPEKIDYIIKAKDKIKSIKLPTIKKKEEVHILTPEEILNYNREEDLIIDGVSCNIIFNDSNKENIIKNYYILLEDINAKMVNGYTLEENKMLKSICMKLNVGNLRNIDINNVSILNRISVEEYNLLKRILM